MYHPNGNRISIVGASVDSRQVDGLVSVSGSTGNYDLVLDLTTSGVIGLNVGDYFVVPTATGGSNPQSYIGCWPITNVDTVNKRITIHTTNHNALTSGGTITSTTAYKIPTIFAFSAGGFYLLRGAHGPVSNILLLGTSAAANTGIYVSPNSQFCVGQRLCLLTWLYGIQTALISKLFVTVSGTTNTLTISNCETGSLSFGGSQQEIPYVCAAGNNYGIVAADRSSIDMSYGRSVNNRNTGAFATGGSYILAAGATILYSLVDANPAINTPSSNLSCIGQ
jgi:hypothetical protein